MNLGGRKKFFIVPFVIILFLSGYSFITRPWQWGVDMGVNTATIYNLPLPELLLYKGLGLCGVKSAAERVSMYYAFSLQDMDKSRDWDAIGYNKMPPK
jgi:hypothetical protein